MSLHSVVMLKRFCMCCGNTTARVTVAPVQLTDPLCFLSTICWLVGPVRSVGKRDELHSRRVLPRSFVLLALLLPGCSVRVGWQPRQPAGPDAHEVQHAVLQLQRRTAKHHPHRWVRRIGGCLVSFNRVLKSLKASKIQSFEFKTLKCLKLS